MEWQTCCTQNAVSSGRVGSSPTAGTSSSNLIGSEILIRLLLFIILHFTRSQASRFPECLFQLFTTLSVWYYSFSCHSFNTASTCAISSSLLGIYKTYFEANILLGIFPSAYSTSIAFLSVHSIIPIGGLSLSSLISAL